MITQDDVVDYLKNVELVDLRSLISTLEDELGVPLPDMSVMQNIVVEPEDVQTEFEVILTGFTGKKIEVIKKVRELTGAGLRDAKSMTENCPTVIAECVTKTRAEELAGILAAVSGTVEIK